jgi:hypothetical protein
MKFWKMFTKPSAMEMAVADLEEAKRQLLQYQTQFEYSLHMVEALQMQVVRLAIYIRKGE